MAKKTKKPGDNTICQNRKARHDYFLEDKVEAGVQLTGWEVKSLRAGKGQLTESYVDFHRGEAWLLGAHLQPLISASTHFVTDPVRPRKLLLNRKEIDRFQRAIEQKGYTVVATALYWKQHMVKCAIALGKGKQHQDKRQTEKDRDFDQQKRRALRAHNREG